MKYTKRAMFATADQRPPASSSEHDRSREDPHPWIPRVTTHEIVFGRIDGERQRRQTVRRQIHVEDLDGGERHRQARDDRTREEHDLADVAGQQIHQIFLDVAEDDAPFLDGGDNRREVIVEQCHARRLLADVRAGDAHGDSDVRLFQGRRVVDAVAGHRHDLPTGLPGFHDAQLVSRATRARRRRFPRRRGGGPPSVIAR